MENSITGMANNFRHERGEADIIDNPYSLKEKRRQLENERNKQRKAERERRKGAMEELEPSHVITYIEDDTYAQHPITGHYSYKAHRLGEAKGILPQY